MGFDRTLPVCRITVHGAGGRNCSLIRDDRWLRGGFGNLVYFFLFMTTMSVIKIAIGPKVPLLDWLGFGPFSNSMGEAARAAYPDYQTGFSFGMIPPMDMQTFYWSGVQWTGSVILTRLITLVLGMGTALLGSLFFDRFEPSREWRRSGLSSASALPEPASVIAAQPAPTIQLTPLSASPWRFQFGGLLLAELRMLLKGLRWWYIVALGLMVASMSSPLNVVRRGLLPALWIWPILLWSGFGCRESRYDTRQMVFSAPRPLWNQLSAMWLAGFAVTTLMVAGAAVRFLVGGEMLSLLSLFVGALFIPSLALMSGVWTGNSKAFEIIYMLIWYAGPLNKLLPLDYIGIYTNEYWQSYILFSLILILLAVIGRKRQLRGR